MQKALIGTLFIWYEKCNSNLIPIKHKVPKVQETFSDPSLPPMPKSVRNLAHRGGSLPMVSARNGRNMQQQQH